MRNTVQQNQPTKLDYGKALCQSDLMETTTNSIAPTRYLIELLITDTRAYEIIKTTAKTITVRAMDKDQIMHRTEGTFPVVTYSATSNPNGTTQTVRLRKDGTFRFYRSGNPLTFVEVPTFRTDYSW